jgi:hypothetical protein
MIGCVPKERAVPDRSPILINRNRRRWTRQSRAVRAPPHNLYVVKGAEVADFVSIQTELPFHLDRIAEWEAAREACARARAVGRGSDRQRWQEASERVNDARHSDVDSRFV